MGLLQRCSLYISWRVAPFICLIAQLITVGAIFATLRYHCFYCCLYFYEWIYLMYETSLLWSIQERQRIQKVCPELNFKISGKLGSNQATEVLEWFFFEGIMLHLNMRYERAGSATWQFRLDACVSRACVYMMNDRLRCTSDSAQPVAREKHAIAAMAIRIDRQRVFSYMLHIPCWPVFMRNSPRVNASGVFSTNCNKLNKKWWALSPYSYFLEEILKERKPTLSLGQFFAFKSKLKRKKNFYSWKQHQ